MICPNCGTKVTGDAIFCQKCGERMPEKSPEVTFDEPLEAPKSPADKLRSASEKLRGEAQAEEDELWRGGYCAKAMLGWWIAAALLTIVAAAVAFTALETITTALFAVFVIAVIGWGGVALLLAYRKLSVHYVLTTQRFVHTRGILRRITDRIEVIDMDDVTFAQGIVERMLGVGSILVSSSDRSHPELKLIGIDRVGEVATLIDDARRNERLRRGLHIEAI